MKKTLLGHLYKHVKGSAEDVATLSLQYLLSSYEKLRKTFNRLIAEKMSKEIDLDTVYECQSVGENNERPDMAGTDSSGKEIILCEAKFYAGLTSNQPVTYLDRLRKENGAGLIVICPKERMVSLWELLLQKCNGLEIEEVSQYSTKVAGVNMALISWEEVLALLTRTAVVEQKESLADVEQLQGYCEQIISQAFMPFKQEELGAIEAKKYERYMYIADRLIDAMCADPDISVSIDGFRATPFRHGYTRYMKIDNIFVSFQFNLELWADDKYIDTPFWVAYFDNGWKASTEAVLKLRTIPETRKAIKKDTVLLAIDTPCGVMEDEVVEIIKRQVLEYLEMIVK